MKFRFKQKYSHLRYHAIEIVKTNPTPIVWPQIILSGLATGVPLTTAYFQGHLSYSIYGALTGYLLTLNDHFGSLKHRLFIITFTLVILICGFSIGLLLKDNHFTFYSILLFIVYMIGLSGGEGAELERGVLFSTIGMIVSFQSKSIDSNSLPILLLYVGLSYVCLISATFVTYYFIRCPVNEFLTLKNSFKKVLITRKKHIIHALSYTSMVLLSVALSYFFNLERGYWVTVTVLLVMKPDSTQSFYKTLQRLIGTAFAVALSEFLAFLISDVRVYLTMVILSAAGVPWALKRNYWIASLFGANLVIFLVEIAANQIGNDHLALIRLQATLFGCTLSILGTFISKIIYQRNQIDRKI